MNLSSQGLRDRELKAHKHMCTGVLSHECQRLTLSITCHSLPLSVLDFDKEFLTELGALWFC